MFVLLSGKCSHLYQIAHIIVPNTQSLQFPRKQKKKKRIYTNTMMYAYKKTLTLHFLFFVFRISAHDYIFGRLSYLNHSLPYCLKYATFLLIFVHLSLCSFIGCFVPLLSYPHLPYPSLSCFLHLLFLAPAFLISTSYCKIGKLLLCLPCLFSMLLLFFKPFK